jgi:predicted TIM-barrel fold metal-dependent hydrolase
VTAIPRIVSADDHVVEPPDVFVSRLPAKYREVGPRVVRKPVAEMTFRGGKYAYAMGEEGPLADWWLYEDRAVPQTRLSACAGFAPEDVQVVPMIYDEMRPGCYQQGPRLDDMDLNWVEASLCFPTFPRFCGQTFLEADDKDLALLCVRAYNDWMVEEWCAGSEDRLVPLCLIPLWDPVLAADEVRRNAARGVRAVCFSELPSNLGLPSVHAADRYWDPFFAACDETETTLCMHIGSSSKMPATSPDAPFIVSSTLTFSNAMGSLCDYIFSGTLDRFPTLTIAYSEGQVGWAPYVIERADKLWAERSANSFGSDLPHPPSSYIPGRVYFCVFDDEVGLANRNVVGMEQITFEVDYPHADSTFPHSKETAQLICDKAGLDDTERYQLLRGNAITAFGLHRFGITA